MEANIRVTTPAIQPRKAEDKMGRGRVDTTAATKLDTSQTEPKSLVHSDSPLSTIGWTPE